MYSEDRLSQEEKQVIKREKDYLSMYKENEVPDELQGYVLGVQKKIYDNIYYPSSLVNTGWQGTVVLKLHLRQQSYGPENPDR